MTSDTNGAMENYPICLSQMGEQMHSSSDKLPGCIAVNSKRDKLTDANVLRPSTLPKSPTTYSADSIQLVPNVNSWSAIRTS